MGANFLIGRRTLNAIKKRTGLIFVLLIIVLVILVYKSDKIVIDLPKKAFHHIHQKTNLDFFPLWSKYIGVLFKAEDEINIFRVKKNLLDGALPIYSLTLGPNDLSHFDNLSEESARLGYLSGGLNKWRAAELNIDGKKYKVEVSLHGDTPTQWSKSLKSYQIKSNKEEYIDGIRRFNLIIFEDKFFEAPMFRIIANELGLMDVRDDLVVLNINGVIQGVYYLQEVADINLLENNKCSSCYLIKNTDNWVEDHSYSYAPFGLGNDNGVIFIDTSHVTPFDYEISNVDLDDGHESRRVMASVNDLYSLVKNNDKKAIDYFDREYLSSFEALRMVVGSTHLIEGDNLKLAYSASYGKFYPIPMGEVISRLRLERGGLDRHLNTYLGKELRLFSLISKDDEVRHLRNKKVYSVAASNSILEDYDKLVEKYGPYITSYKTNDFNSRILKYYFKDLRNILEFNMAVIKRNLEYSKIYANVFLSGNKVTIELLPDSIAELKAENFKIILNDMYKGSISLFLYQENNFVFDKTFDIDNSQTIDLADSLEKIFFSAGLTEDLFPKSRVYKFEIIFNGVDAIDVKNIDIEMINDITGSLVAKSDTYVKIADVNYFYPNSRYMAIEEFIKEFSDFKWTYGNRILKLEEGDYILKKDMIIPRTKQLIISPGTEILMEQNVSIISYSPALIEGTKDKMIKITAIDKNGPFGTFAIIGNNERGEKTIVSWLDISGGKDRWVNGMFFIGQFSIYNMPDVQISNIFVHGSRGDDGMNIKNANVVIENSKFYGNFADQVDLDFVKGVIKNSEFNGKGELDGNGDGLDLSGSKVIIKNNILTNMLDKGISLGEDSMAIIYKNNVLNNNLGVAVKDYSKAHFAENTFAGNDVGLTAYQKKQLFGGSTAYVYKNTFASNSRNFENDNASSILKIEDADKLKKIKDIAENEALDFE